MRPGFFGKRLWLWGAVLLFLLLHGCSTKYIIKSPEYAMFKGEINQHARLIHAEKSRIFQILTQEETFEEICPEGTTVTHESPPPFRVGTLLKTRIEHVFELEWSSQVQEVIPDSKIRLQFLDGFFAGGMEIWELEGEGEYTRVAHTIIVQPRGILKKATWVLKVRLKHDKMTEALLDNLKKASETP